MPDDIIKNKEEENIAKVFKNPIEERVSFEREKDLEKNNNQDEEKIENIKDELVGEKKETLDEVSEEKQEQISVVKQIEQILQSGNEELYREMSVSRKLKFKNVGEDISIKIKDFLFEYNSFSVLSRITSANMKISKITKMIRNWLLISPDIDKNYAEQEARLKINKIVELSKE